MRTIVTEKNGKVYHITEWDKDECLYAIDSAATQGAKVQYLFMDYDKNYPTGALDIMCRYGYKRGLIVETSKGRWAFLTFSPTPISQIFEILWNCPLIDRGHAGCFLRFRQSSLRVSQKANAKGYPKIRKVLENQYGNQFYDYDREKGYRKTLKLFKADVRIPKKKR